jgi:hypothetical protein
VSTIKYYVTVEETFTFEIKVEANTDECARQIACESWLAYTPPLCIDEEAYKRVGFVLVGDATIETKVKRICR